MNIKNAVCIQGQVEIETESKQWSQKQNKEEIHTEHEEDYTQIIHMQVRDDR